MRLLCFSVLLLRFLLLLQVFYVVSRIDEYPQFIPWCRTAKILQPASMAAPGPAPSPFGSSANSATPHVNAGTSDESSVRRQQPQHSSTHTHTQADTDTPPRPPPTHLERETILAQLDIGFKGLSEKYTSQVTLQPYSSIRVGGRFFFLSHVAALYFLPCCGMNFFLRLLWCFLHAR